MPITEGAVELNLEFPSGKMRAVDVYYEHCPYQRSTRDDPEEPEYVKVFEIVLAGAGRSGRSVLPLFDAQIESIEEKILERILRERDRD